MIRSIVYSMESKYKMSIWSITEGTQIKVNGSMVNGIVSIEVSKIAVIKYRFS